LSKKRYRGGKAYKKAEVKGFCVFAEVITPRLHF